jgi:hypothetical protein
MGGDVRLPQPCIPVRRTKAFIKSLSEAYTTEKKVEKAPASIYEDAECYRHFLDFEEKYSKSRNPLDFPRRQYGLFDKQIAH